MSLRIIKAGVLDTIQDMGRYGFQSLGINPTGAMDKLSMQATNILVGNEPNGAVIEIHFPASIFLFQQPTLLALGGADFSASINGEPLPLWHPVMITRNCILQFHEPIKGARAYLAVKGGFNIPVWLNSYSTHLKAKTGGYNGRALQKDDELIINETTNSSFSSSQKEFMILPWHADIPWIDKAGKQNIYVLKGNEWNWLSETAQKKFLKQEFTISSNSDRMGYRLNAASLETAVKEEVISSAVNFGTVQMLPGKQLIILMADHQTTGGYPRVAHVITAHQTKLAQMRVGDKIRFAFTDQQTAEQLLIKQHQHLRHLQEACKFKLEEFLNK